ncbi:MAG: hydrogenase formation protein HypD [Thermoanaerobaculales bacterium]|nr:hydrogenase formation protein HypD [Thermoanaerobaculales bacterium]
MSSNTDMHSDPKAIKALLVEIENLSMKLGRRAAFMEVCGTHTHAVAAAGLRRRLPENVRLVSGPGCPVCVTPIEYLDRAIALAALPDVTVCSFGDMLRVPSSSATLEEARADGHSIEIVYSPRDALQFAEKHPDRRVVFLAVGFETTVPTIAAALAEAETLGIKNFLILPGNKVMPPPMQALAGDPELRVEGFLLPGHVSVITGWETFLFLADEHGMSGAVVGFAPADVLRGIAELLRQLIEERHEVVNLYNRVVDARGNITARVFVDRFFEPTTVVWRGFGAIPGSGLRLRPEWRHRDASLIEVELPEPVEPSGCRCGDVLRGQIEPPECPLFAKSCTPDSAVGACMVSSEGACAAWYRHERFVIGSRQ